MKTLVIIDMQEAYLGDDSYSLLQRVVHLIHEFGRKRWPIILVEYDCACSDTDQEIIDALWEYEDLVKVVHKERVSGAAEVLYELRRTQWPKDLVVAGVYGNCCVSATVDWLVKLEPKINVEVRTDCIWPEYAYYECLDEEQQERIQFVGG